MLLRTLLLTFLASAGASPATKSCRCRPSNSCWPSEAEWQSLNQTSHGNLHALRPIGAVCRDSEYDADACEVVRSQQHNSTWRTSRPAAVEWPNWEAWPEQGESCYPDTEKSVPCGQGRVSLYTILAESPQDIQAGVRFAREHNLRLAIRNTGHDFSGRSTAPESLQINTHLMTDKSVHKNFKPAGCDTEGEGLAVTLGAGVQLWEMYKWLGEHNLMVVGGSSHGVGVAGGYIQGGGHSMIAAIGGMASDNALEFTVVTADGKHVTANAYENSDLFWALRGGGGGTWGVVTSVTLRAFDEIPMVSFTLSGGAAYGNESFWEAVEHFHKFLPKFNDAGGNMYYYLLPDFQDPSLGHVSAITASGAFGNASSQDAIDRLMKPFVKDLSDITGTSFNYTSTYTQKATDLYVSLYEGPDATGERAILGSRIVTRDFLMTDAGPGQLTAALRSLRTFPGNSAQGSQALHGLVVAGPAVAANAGRLDSALHPVWRRALLHFVIARGWAAETSVADQQALQRNLTHVEVPILKSLDPSSGGGAYLNEADAYEQDFQDSFWGSNYPRLYELKQKWDPQNLFIVKSGVGSEDWDDEGLCPKQGALVNPRHAGSLCAYLGNVGPCDSYSF